LLVPFRHVPDAFVSNVSYLCCMELGLLDGKQQLWRRFKSNLGLWGCANPLRLVVIWMDLEKISTRPYLAICECC